MMMKKYSWFLRLVLSWIIRCLVIAREKIRRKNNNNNNNNKKDGSAEGN